MVQQIVEMDLYDRRATFLYKLANSQNELCQLFEFIVREELNLLT